MRELNRVAASLLPSPDMVMDVQFPAGALVAWVQVIPESPEVKIDPAPITAANFVPSADAAISDQFALVGLVGVQFPPPFVEI